MLRACPARRWAAEQRGSFGVRSGPLCLHWQLSPRCCVHRQTGVDRVSSPPVPASRSRLPPIGSELGEQNTAVPASRPVSVSAPCTLSTGKQTNKQNIILALPNELRDIRCLHSCFLKGTGQQHGTGGGRVNAPFREVQTWSELSQQVQVSRNM